METRLRVVSSGHPTLISRLSGMHLRLTNGAYRALLRFSTIFLELFPPRYSPDPQTPNPPQAKAAVLRHGAVLSEKTGFDSQE